VNTNSNLCVDATGWGIANGTIVQQYTCGAAQANQEWQFQLTDSGYYRVVNRNAYNATATNVVWDVTGGPRATADQIPVQLWIC
jgi:glucosylceramidase